MSVLAKVQLRVVHARGFTDVAFSPDGSRILTAGDDAMLRIVSTETVRDEDDDELDDAVVSAHHKGAITCMSANGNYVVTGSEDQVVNLYDSTSGQLKTMLLRSTLTVRAVAFRPGRHGPRKSQWVAIASDELDIRLVDLGDITNLVEIKGHKCGLKSLAFDPTGDYLVSASCDGNLNVWDLRNMDGKAKLARSLGSIIAESEPEANEYCRIAWHPSGQRFAVPGKLGEVAIIEAITWKHIYSLREQNRSDAVTLLAWSPTGAYLAAASTKGRLCVWRPENDKKIPCVADQAHARLTGLAWHPKQHDICLTDELGRMGYWRDAVSASGQETDALGKLFHENAMDVDDEVPPLPGQPSRKTVLDSNLPSDFEDDDDIALKDSAGADDFVVDDDGAGYAGPLEKPGELRRYHEKGRRQVIRDIDNEFGTSRIFGGMAAMDAQDAFQPGATPFKKDRRYLAFNMVGVIYTIDASTHHNVNVEFHDRSIRPFHFTDYHNYSIAALASSGACFASTGTAGNPSKIFYRALDTWAANADWTIHLGDHESVLSLAITSKGPVAATTSRFLRFFSHSGLQTFVLSMPGRVVTMAAQGDWLIVIYHAGGVYHGDQNLAYMLYDCKTRTTVKKDGVPLSAGATLTWAGISELGLPATYDSTGVLRSLLPHSDFAWVPVFDSRTLRGDTQNWYWPVEVLDSTLMCVVCKAGDKHPGHPRPLLTDVPLQAPFLELGPSNSTAGATATTMPATPPAPVPPAAQEEKLFRASLLATHLRARAAVDGIDKEKELLRKDVEIDKIVVGLVLAACREEKVQRALDLCNTLRTMKAIDGAIKIAVVNRLPALAERMNLVKEHRMRIAAAEERASERASDSRRETNDFDYWRPQETLSQPPSPKALPPRAIRSDFKSPSHRPARASRDSNIADHTIELAESRAAESRESSPPPLDPPARPMRRGNPFAAMPKAVAAPRQSLVGKAAMQPGAGGVFDGLREATAKKVTEDLIPAPVKRKHNQSTLLASLRSKVPEKPTEDLDEASEQARGKRRCGPSGEDASLGDHMDEDDDVPLLPAPRAAGSGFDHSTDADTLLIEDTASMEEKENASAAGDKQPTKPLSPQTPLATAPADGDKATSHALGRFRFAAKSGE
ncbi:hypothetical protein HDU86_008389 [Geranomyces michiganensis]|nr:hypothetical protein HDU86_008389 [Geranomyces michiganensis]